LKVDYLDVGQRIRRLRISKGITQEQLAEMVDAGTTHISHIETGNTIPSMKIFIAIVNALDASADELLCESLVHAKEVFTGEIADAVSDCSEEEIRMIADVVKCLKTSMRKRK
jgi:transcriptional regulator with XRE-family HTH domain